MASVVMPIGFKVRVLYTPHLLASFELPHGLGLWSLLNKFNLMIRGQRLTQRKSQLQAHRSLFLSMIMIMIIGGIPACIAVMHYAYLRI